LRTALHCWLPPPLSPPLHWRLGLLRVHDLLLLLHVRTCMPPPLRQGLLRAHDASRRSKAADEDSADHKAVLLILDTVVRPASSRPAFLRPLPPSPPSTLFCSLHLLVPFL